MLSIHLAMSLGLGIGPLISTPFLDGVNFPREEGTYGITTLYPILGGIACASALSFLIIGIRDIKITNNEKQGPKSGHNLQSPEIDGRRVTFVVLMCIFFFLYNGMEYSLGTFLSIFSVNSNLHATKAEGTYVTSIFFCSIAAGQFAALFFARYMMPHIMVLTSMIFCVVGGAALIFVGQYSLITLEVR